MTVATTPARTAKSKSAITRDRYHRYTYAGSRYPGVTGIIKIVDKSDALIAWASRNTAEAALAQLDNLASLRDTVGPDGVVKALTARSGWKRDSAANIGSDIHDMAQVVAEGRELPNVDVAIRSRVDAYAEWWATSGWRLRLAEAYVIDTRRGYGGTIDILAYDEQGRTTLADIKTGKSVYAETRLQLVGYGDAELIAPQDSPTAYPMPTVERYVVLHVTESGVECIDVDIDGIDREAFRSCIPLSAWRKDRKGRLAV